MLIREIYNNANSWLAIIIIIIILVEILGIIRSFEFSILSFDCLHSQCRRR